MAVIYLVTAGEVESGPDPSIVGTARTKCRELRHYLPQYPIKVVTGQGARHWQLAAHILGLAAQVEYSAVFGSATMMIEGGQKEVLTRETVLEKIRALPNMTVVCTDADLLVWAFGIPTERVKLGAVYTVEVTDRAVHMPQFVGGVSED